ncbi:MAG: C40 family peptidase [Saccharofermentans sp.]|nr:C40 family peptidase [Saccharofermentans sp.]
MGDLFQKIVEMSLMGSVVILITVFARFLLRNRSKRFIMILWAVVAVRLLLPINIKSEISIFNYLPAMTKTDVATAEVKVAALPDNVDTKQVTTNAVSQYSQDGIITAENADYTEAELPAEAAASAIELPDIRTVFAIVWLTGTSVIIGYCSVRYIALKRRLKDANKIGKNVYESEKVKAPFVFGLLVPRIYLPDVLDNSEREYILKHERTHIKHGDWISKIVGVTVVAVHWFNPLVWLAYVLFEQDIEMNCDESVVANMGADVKQAYTMSIVAYARKSNNKRYLVTPLGFSRNSFSKVEVTNRVKNIINYKEGRKITAVMITAAMLFVGAACSLNSKDKNADTTFVSGQGTIKSVTANEYASIKSVTEMEYAEKYILKSLNGLQSVTVYVNADWISARTGPGDDYPSAESYSGGDPIVVVDITDNGWYKTDSGNYVNGRLCSDVNYYTVDSSILISGIAKSLIGCPYEAGGEFETGFDDAGLIVYVYKENCSLGLPHDIAELAQCGIEVDPDDIFDGDIICFDEDHDGVMEHCGIYVGSNTYVHVLPDKGVVKSCYSDVKYAIGTVQRVVEYPEVMW